jgi:hypothetical protein
MKNRFGALILILGLFMVSTRVWATPILDKSYALRSFVPAVINGTSDPVYSEHVENELIKYLRTHPRFDFPSQAYLNFKKDIQNLYLNDPNTATRDKLAWMKTAIDKLADQNVDGLIVAELFHSGDSYRISVVVSSVDGSFDKAKEVNVEDSASLDSFTEALTKCMDDLESSFPFDGSVVRRDGYRVVLDRVGPELFKGLVVSTYTVDKHDEKLYLRETGRVKITEVGDTLSFGDIQVEHKPLEVNTSNKILFAEENVKRDPAFEDLEARFSNRQLGKLDLQVGANAVTLDNRTASGNGLSDGTNYLGGTLHGEVWLTAHVYLDLGITFGISTLTASSLPGDAKLNSNINDIRTNIGYRLGLGDPRAGLTIDARLGYSRHAIQVDPTNDPLGFYTSVYSGLNAGASATYPISKKWGLGFDVDAMLFPSMSESPLTSGASVTSASGWNFGLRGFYHYNENIDIIARISYEIYSSEFSGIGTRPVPLANSSESGRIIGIGAAYYF